MCVHLYYKLIFINKFIKHNQVNDLNCDIKYLDLYWFLDFSNYVFIYHYFFFIYSHNSLWFIWLNACISFSIFIYDFFLCKSMHWKILHVQVFYFFIFLSCIDIFNIILILIISKFFFYKKFIVFNFIIQFKLIVYYFIYLFWSSLIVYIYWLILKSAFSLRLYIIVLH